MVRLQLRVFGTALSCRSRIRRLCCMMLGLDFCLVVQGSLGRNQQCVALVLSGDALKVDSPVHSLLRLEVLIGQCCQWQTCMYRLMLRCHFTHGQVALLLMGRSLGQWVRTEIGLRLGSECRLLVEAQEVTRQRSTAWERSVWKHMLSPPVRFARSKCF